jgi:regulator of protease activity HflC (stomatin/prohibitin superfamily)
MLQEIRRTPVYGVPLLIALPVGLTATILGMGWAFDEGRYVEAALLLAASVALGVALAGFFRIAPNEGKVLQLFGRYVGTAREPGLRWANPFYSKHRVSLRVRNFETARLKVNDNHGNPVEIGAVVVWRVFDTAEAVFEVDDYENFVHVQSESALRNLATGYPYDAHESGEVSLSGNTADISEQLKVEIQERLGRAGVEVT